LLGKCIFRLDDKSYCAFKKVDAVDRGLKGKQAFRTFEDMTETKEKCLKAVQENLEMLFIRLSRTEELKMHKGKAERPEKRSSFYS
jgi:hypothetical protein